jgi:SAM-dependent methyltransferase
MAFIGKDKHRPFYLCNGCGLVSVPEKYWLDADGERARYDLHNNNVLNDGYVRFLSQVADAAMKDYRPGMRILDFGSGKDAVLCQLLRDRGVGCYAYDPICGRSLPEIGDADKPYLFDMILLCEVIEHIRDIQKELDLINGLIREGGAILLRTQIYESPSVFPGWWYAQDPTHINFFNEKSLNRLAGMTGRCLERTDYNDIFLLRNASQSPRRASAISQYDGCGNKAHRGPKNSIL